jgi:large repetitive protein
MPNNSQETYDIKYDKINGEYIAKDTAKSWTKAPFLMSISELERRLNGDLLNSGYSFTYDFLSNIKDPEAKRRLRTTTPFNSAPLLADSELTEYKDSLLSTLTIPDTTIGHDSIVEIGSVESEIFKVGYPAEIGSGQISSVKGNIPAHFSVTEIGSGEISRSETYSLQTGFPQRSTTQISTDELGLPATGTTQIGTTQIGTKETSLRHESFSQIGSPQVSLTKILPGETDTSEIGITQVGSRENNHIEHTVSSEFGSAQVDAQGKIVTKLGNLEFSKIPLSGSVTREQFFDSNPVFESIDHTHSSIPQYFDNINNSALNLWNNLLKPQTTFDINLEITNLSTGQLAEAQITQFDNQGIPIGGTLRIDDDANGVGWFIDPTPQGNSEFEYTLSETAYRAAPDSPAFGRYDLYTTILNEMGHLFGFLKGVGGYDRYLQTPNGRSSLVGPDFNVLLSGDLSHLDPSEYPNDLMNPFLRTNLRKLPTQLDIQILNAVRSSQLEKQWSVASQNNAPLLAPLTAPPLIPILNGDFEIEEKTNPESGWSDLGSTNIEQGYAVLREDSPFLSNLSQTFLIPEGQSHLVKY